MSKLKEKLKNVASKLSRLGEWVGNHFGTLLTIFSAVAAFLFLRERSKRQEAETTLELDEKADAVADALQEVEHAQQEADSTYADYTQLKSKYDSGKRKQKANPARNAKKRAAKRTKKRKA